MDHLFTKKDFYLLQTETDTLTPCVWYWGRYEDWLLTRRWKCRKIHKVASALYQIRIYAKQTLHEIVNYTDRDGELLIKIARPIHLVLSCLFLIFESKRKKNKLLFDSFVFRSWLIFANYVNKLNRETGKLKSERLHLNKSGYHTIKTLTHLLVWQILLGQRLGTAIALPQWTEV